MNNSIEEIKIRAKKINEAEGGAAFIAWNGLTGLAYAIQALFGVTDIGIIVWNALLPGLGFLPTWVILLTEMGIIITIILVIIGAFKGEAKT